MLIYIVCRDILFIHFPASPSPPISTAPEPPASASCHPYGRSIHLSSASHSNAVPVRSANPAGNCHFKCKSPSMRVESCGRTPQQVPKYSILHISKCADLTKMHISSAIIKHRSQVQYTLSVRGRARWNGRSRALSGSQGTIRSLLGCDNASMGAYLQMSVFLDLPDLKRDTE